MNLPATQLSVLIKDVAWKYDIAPHTMKNEISHLNDFESFVTDMGLYHADYGFHDHVFLLYKRHITATVNLKNSTKRQRLVAVGKFLRTAFEYDKVDKDLTKGVKLPSAPEKHLKEGLYEEELTQIISKVEKFEDEKLKSMVLSWLYLMAYNGLRQFEVLKIKHEDINLKSGVLMVKGKKRFIEEPVTLHPEAFDKLKQYLVDAEITEGYIYQSPRSKSPKPLSTRYMQKILRPIIDEVDENKSIHGCRKFFITKVLEITHGDVNLARELSRGRAIETIQAYDNKRRLKMKIPEVYNKFTLNPS